MAEPLRKDPPSQQTPDSFNIHRYGNPHRGASRWWFWILLAGVIVWFVVWGRNAGAHKPQPVTTATLPPKTTGPAAPAEKPSTNVPMLLANPQHYIGQEVHLRDVLVDGVNGDASIFVGPTNKQTILVILKKGSVPVNAQGKPTAIPKEGIVTLTGTAQKPGSLRDLEKAAKLHRKEADQVIKQGLLIEASQVTPQTM